MDIFEKCYAHSYVDQLREQDLFPFFRELQSRQDVEVIMEGKRRIMLGSNNYLGLTVNPEIVAAGLKALQEAHPDIDIYCGCVDSHLNENAYIVPGLGDAGDRIFGTK